jgi:hypothetical protein
VGNKPKAGALSGAWHDALLVEEKENSFSFREKARVRGIKSGSYPIIPPLPGSLPAGVGASGNFKDVLSEVSLWL